MTANSTQNSSGADAEDLSMIASKATLIVLIIIVGTVGNVCLIIGVVGTKRLRSSSQYLFTLNLAVVNILECAISMTITLAATITSTWQIPGNFCKVHAFIFNTLWIETLLGITFLAMDRMMAVRLPNKYSEVHNPPRVAIMLAYTWVHSILFSVPQVFGLVPVNVHSYINMCMMSTTTSLSYVSALSVCCFLIPIVVIAVFLVLIVKTVYTERKTHLETMTRHHYSHEIEEPKFFKELSGAKFVGSVFVMWVVIVSPFLTAVFIHLFKELAADSTSSASTSEYSSLMYVIFLLAKFLFVFVLPVFAFFFKKEVWHSFRDIVLCRKLNAVDVANKNKENAISDNCTIEKLNIESDKRKEEKAKEAYIHNSGFQVPVLFATSNGVHIQTYGFEESDECEEPAIRERKCDVIGSQGNLQQLEDDTSDYDSGNEMDPFSVSHPISAKHAKDLDSNALQKRSNSQPEFRGSKTNQNNQNSKTSVTITSAVDSGLDISSKGLTNISELKKSLSGHENDQENSLMIRNQTTSKINKNHKSNPQGFVDLRGGDNSKLSAQGVDNGAFEGDVDKTCTSEKHEMSPGKSPGEKKSHTDGAKGSVKSGKKNKSMSLTMPSFSQKKKRNKKSNKSEKSNETIVSPIEHDDMDACSVNSAIPPRPPARLAPIQKGASQTLYRRMSEESVVVGQVDDISAISPSKKGNPSPPHQAVAEDSERKDLPPNGAKAKRKSNTRSPKRRKNVDSQTSLLDSCSSADLNSLKDAAFISDSLDDSSQLGTPHSQEVTTPSACHLVDLKKDFENKVGTEQSDQ